MNKIKKIEYVEDYNDFVYSLNVEDNHNFYLSNGVLSKNCLLILDEAQNCDIRDLMMFVTRMGKNSKVIICGDVSQHDIKYETVAIPYFEKLISDIPGVSVFKFTDDDIMRNGILKEITKRYEKEKAEGKIPKMKK